MINCILDAVATSHACMHGSLDTSSCVSMSLLPCTLCCRSGRASKVSYAEEFDSELDSDPDDAKKKSKANMAVALMDSTEDLDDEVERVLGHRWAACRTAHDLDVSSAGGRSADSLGLHTTMNQW